MAANADLRIQMCNARMPIYEKYNQNRGNFLHSSFFDDWKRAGTTNCGVKLETNTGEYSAGVENRNNFPSETRPGCAC
jgi:hypothetical protein